MDFSSWEAFIVQSKWPSGFRILRTWTSDQHPLFILFVLIMSITIVILRRPTSVMLLGEIASVENPPAVITTS